jgi:hypothetical protein
MNHHFIVQSLFVAYCLHFLIRSLDWNDLTQKGFSPIMLHTPACFQGFAQENCHTFLRGTPLRLRAIESNTMNRLQILIGVAGLILGSLVYLIDRPPDQTYFVSFSKINISLHNTVPNLFGVIGNTLPDFLHVFSFILITAGLFSCNRKGYLIICSGWFLVDSAFELCQKYNSLPLRIIPDWFEGIPFLENTKNYFQRGTFDMVDLLAIAVGTIVAYFVIVLTTTKRRETA